MELQLDKGALAAYLDEVFPPAGRTLISPSVTRVPMAVTSALNVNFLRGCQPTPVHADARLLKLGRRLATVDVRVWQETEERLVAQATVGYARP